MAEKGDVPVRLELNVTACTSSRRSSMGWTIFSNSGEKLVPRYLRASTGSCHDVCKYGRNHTFETKSRQPIPKYVTRRSLGGGRSVDSVVLPERKKTGGTLTDSVVIPERKIAATTQMSKNVTRKPLDGASSIDSMVLPERKKTSSTRMLKNVARQSLDGGSSVGSMVLPERTKTSSTQMLKKVARKSLDGASSVDSMVLPERKKTSSTRMLKNVARKSLDGGSSVDSIVLPERKKTSSTRMLKNVTRKSLDGGSSVDSMVLPERKKTSLALILKNVARKSLDGGSSVDSMVLPGRQKTTSTRLPKNVDRKSIDGGSSVDSVILPEGKKTTSTRAKAEFLSTSSISEADLTTFIRPRLSLESSSFPRPVQRDVLNERKKKLLPIPMQREVLNERKKLLGEPRTLPKSRSHTENALKNLKPETSSATRNPEDSVVQVVAKAKERKLPEKSDKISKLKSIKVNPLRSAVSLVNSRRKKDSKMGKSCGTSKVAAKKVVAVSTGSISSNSIDGTANVPARKCVNLKGVPLKNHNKIEVSEREHVRSEEVEGKTFPSEEVQGETFQSEKVQEKTLYVIKIENEEIHHQSEKNETDDNMEPLPSSPPKSLSLTTSAHISADVEDQDVSEYTETEAEDSYSESNEIGSMKADNVSSEGGKKGRSQNLRMLKTKEMDPQSTKLSFRRGKIIDVRSENYSPRRLKFRRVRLLGESQRAADGLRKNFKRGKEVDSNTATAQETVVLRHQDVQGKKDAHGLYNNVIEETASKLVETRKSKVKALVGAFETVIFLQDGKPSLGLDTVS